MGREQIALIHSSTSSNTDCAHNWGVSVTLANPIQNVSRKPALAILK